ncbi:Calcium-transporting ATPase 1 [compost metagenome]
MAETLPLSGRLNEAFAGGIVTIGSGTMLVTATGAHTEVGRIGRLLSETIRPKAPLGERLDALGRYLVWTVSTIATLIVLLGLWQGQALGPLTETAIVLAIAAIPEGLPSVATLALAAGAKRLAEQGLRLRHIGALEALGSITTLCLDKTGTLTTNAMTVQEIRVGGHRIIVSGEGWVPQGDFREEGVSLTSPTRALISDLLQAAQWCNDATLEAHDGQWHIHGDPSEGALLVVAAKAGLADARTQFPRRGAIPAGQGHPWMLVAYALPDQTVAFVKGAPDEVLARCATSRDEHGGHPLGEEERACWLRRNREMADAALRVFGVAIKPVAPSDPDLERNWEWLGLIGMSDPPRPDAMRALKEAHRAGIRTVMITGDQAPTAVAIARKLDLASGQEPQVVIGARHPVPEATVYARATPESKFALVLALQENGQVVAMTGDGVNDAPALRAAVVGIAMGHGTDVARDAASVVLMDERLSTILTGIREGRSAFLNIQKAIDYLLTCSTTMMLAILLAIAAGYPTPLLPLQILYLNLLLHSFPALGLAMEPSGPGVMARPPLARRTELVSASRLASILWHAVIISVATLAMWAWGWSHGGAAHGRTLAFATLALALILHTFSDRSPQPFGGWFGGRNLTLLGCVGIALGFQVAAIHWPGLSQVLQLTALGFADWLNVVVAAIATGVAVEISKKAIPPV